MKLLKSIVAPVIAAASLMMTPFAHAATVDLASLGLEQGDAIVSDLDGTLDVLILGPGLSAVTAATDLFASPAILVTGLDPFGPTDFGLAFTDSFLGLQGFLGESVALAADGNSIEILFDVLTNTSSLTMASQVLVSIVGTFATDASGNPFGVFAVGQAASISIFEVNAAGAAPVPLPAGLPLMAAGLGVMGLIRSRRKPVAK